MDGLKGKLAGIGSLVALFGIASIVLYLIGYNLRILMWIDIWGSTVGWGIRIGMVVVGGALFLLGSLGGSGDAEQVPDDASG